MNGAKVCANLLWEYLGGARTRSSNVVLSTSPAPRRARRSHHLLILELLLLLLEHLLAHLLLSLLFLLDGQVQLEFSR